MNGRGYGLAEMGLFLLLAFVLPGFVYLVFLVFLFPNLLGQMASSSGFTNDVALFAVILGFIGGLLLTSVCFFLEMLLSKIKLFRLLEIILRKIKLVNKTWRLFPAIKISRLGKFEASGKSSVYLHQVTGQAIMHFNVATGLLLMLAIYLIDYDPVSQGYIAAALFLPRLLITLVLIIVNYTVAANFYNWAKGAMDEVENMKSPMEK